MDTVRAFLAELRRRKVYQVAVVYAAVAFAVWQVADIAFPSLGLPESAVGVVLVVTLLGFLSRWCLRGRMRCVPKSRWRPALMPSSSGPPLALIPGSSDPRRRQMSPRRRTPSRFSPSRA